MSDSVAVDISAVQSIGAVPTIMRVIAESTGLRWVCVARVTPDAWTMCAVHDELDFGVVPGDEIPIANTFCDTVRRSGEEVVIDDVSNDPVYADHRVPKMFGFASYFSLPVYRKDGSFFGTLCGLDPKPAHLKTPKTLDTLKLFAELLSGQIDADLDLSTTRAALKAERETAELREQFIAVLGHDLRTPLASMLSGGELIKMLTADEKIVNVVDRIDRSGRRIARLVDDVMDFAHGKMGGALPLHRRLTADLQATIIHVIAEIGAAHQGRVIDAAIDFDAVVYCDDKRVAQLLSNLLVNAIVHGDPTTPIRVTAHVREARFIASVANSGPTIPVDTMERLFRPFWRGANAAKSSGLGLGLYIASEIAASHGGSLLVDSNAHSTIFTFSFDAAPGDLGDH